MVFIFFHKYLLCLSSVSVTNLCSGIADVRPVDWFHTLMSLTFQLGLRQKKNSDQINICQMLDNAVLHGNYMTNITSNSQNNIWCCCCPLLPSERGGKYLLLKAPQKHRHSAGQNRAVWSGSQPLRTSSQSFRRWYAKWQGRKRCLVRHHREVQPYANFQTIFHTVRPFFTSSFSSLLIFHLFCFNLCACIHCGETVMVNLLKCVHCPVPWFSFVWWYIDCLLPPGVYLQWL